jgi:hypothetical protein
VTHASGTVRLEAKRDKTVVSARAKGGRATVTLRFTKAAKRALRPKPKVTLRISGAGTNRAATLKR